MPRPDHNPTQLTWLGHATVLLELGGLRLLTDPVLGRRVGALRRVAPPVDTRAFDRVDVVLLSHLHADHLDMPSLWQLGSGAAIVGPPAVAAWLRGRGLARVTELVPGAATRVGTVTVEATHARHDGRRWPRGPAEEAIGFLVQGERSVYFAGDTDLFPEMSSLAGRVDVALLPIWGWGPALGPGHLDPERAAEAVATIRPQLAIPIHWGTLAPPWTRPDHDALHAPAQAFAAAVARLAPDTDVRLLEPGESLALGEMVSA